MRHEESKCCSNNSSLILIRNRYIINESRSVLNSYIVIIISFKHSLLREGRYIILGIFICEVVCEHMKFFKSSVSLNKAKIILRKSIVIYEVKTESAILIRRSYLREGALLSGSHDHIRICLMKLKIQFLDELNSLQILMSAVDIGYPLTVILGIIQIEHA